MTVTTTLPDRDLGPTLGVEVIDWAHTSLVHGPGPLHGDPYRMSPLFQFLTMWAYEVYPQGHALAGHRRWPRVVLTIRKGAAKTEWMAVITGVELHHEGPVRVCRWLADGTPVGAPKSTPYVPLMAYNADQADDLAFSVLSKMVEHETCPTRADWSVTKDEITRANGMGKVQALATSPGRDGALTTFQGFDETHRMTLPRHHVAHSLMLENAEKNLLLDAWSLEATTMHEPGRGSVSEHSTDDAESIIESDNTDAGLLYFRLSADQHLDLTALDDPDVRWKALEDASGVSINAGLPRARLESIHSRWDLPHTDRPYLARAWMALPMSSAGKWTTPDRWSDLTEPRDLPEDQCPIALGFVCAGPTNDGIALIGVELDSGWTWPVGIWTPPNDWPGNTVWNQPRDEVLEAVAATHERWTVERMLCTPTRWETEVQRWRGRYGSKVVRDMRQEQTQKLIPSIWATTRAIDRGDWNHSGDPELRSHVLTAEREQNDKYEMPDDTFGFLIVKSATGAPIVAALAVVLGHEARRMAIGSGALDGEDETPTKPQVHGGDPDQVAAALAQIRKETANARRELRGET